jgi:hypothetical protein
LYSAQPDTTSKSQTDFFQGLTMSSSDAFALRRSRLDEFLFAPVGTEPSGLTLSLLSVFARRGDDPWKEAGKLVGLPKGDAIESVALTIVQMSRSVWPLLDATAIATRLVALLPTRLGDVVPPPSMNNRTLIAQRIGIGLMLVVLGFAMAFTSGLFGTDQEGKPNGNNVSMMNLAAPPSAPTN